MNLFSNVKYWYKIIKFFKQRSTAIKYHMQSNHCAYRFIFRYFYSIDLAWQFILRDPRENPKIQLPASAARINVDEEEREPAWRRKRRDERIERGGRARKPAPVTRGYESTARGYGRTPERSLLACSRVASPPKLPPTASGLLARSLAHWLVVADA